MRRRCFNITEISMRAARSCLLFGFALLPPVSHAQQPSLWESIIEGDIAAIESYLDAGGDPNGSVGSPPGETAPMLKVAIFDREQAIALALLRAGADFELLGETLAVVTSEGLDEVLEFLLAQQPGRLSRAVTADGGMRVVSPPATRGYVDVLRILLEAAERYETDWNPEVLTEALAAAISFRQSEAARMLLRHGAVPTGMVLRVAARDGSPGIVRALLEFGVDPSARLAERDVDPVANARTAIEYAWRRYNSDQSQRPAARLIMRLLIEAGARNEDAVTGNALVPSDILRIEDGPSDDPAERLFCAARYGFPDDAAALIRGGRFDARTRGEAARIALIEQQNDVARLLIESGLPIDDGILHAAARSNSPSIVRMLVSRGADPTLAIDDRTPIQHWWERQQHGFIGIGGHYVLHELIRAGAPACWLREYESSLDAVTHMFLKSDAPECWRE